MAHTDFPDRHTQMPAKLVFYQTKDGKQSVALCYPWEDLQARAMRYVSEWDSMFPDNPLTYVATQDVEWPE